MFDFIFHFFPIIIISQKINVMVKPQINEKINSIKIYEYCNVSY